MLGQATPGAGKLLEAPARQTGLRVLPGPQMTGFSDAAIKLLTQAEFKVSADASRIGVRLAGPALSYRGGELPSQAVLPGGIQVPPGGQPIALGWDGPVTGGYPVIAGIIAADMPVLAQSRPGDTLSFDFVTLEQAQAAWRHHQEYMNRAIAWDG